MNLTSFASSLDYDAGEGLPWDKPPKHHSFIASEIMPFATNLNIQKLSCSGRAGSEAGGSEEDDQEREDDVEDQADVNESHEDEVTEDKRAKMKRGWWPPILGGSDDSDDSDDSDSSETSSSKNKHKTKKPANAGQYIRIILNDAVVPLTGINGCEENDDGMCSFDTFVSGMKEIIGRVDFARDCGVREEVVDL